MNHNSCPFCRAIEEGLYFSESKDFVALYNQAPVLPGHCLIVPKRHVDSVFALDAHEQKELVPFSVFVSDEMLRIFQASGFNWTIQHGKSAGQTVDHLHLHIIPRHDGDLPDPGDWYPKLEQVSETPIDSDKRPKLKSGEIEKVTKHLRAQMKRFLE